MLEEDLLIKFFDVAHLCFLIPWRLQSVRAVDRTLWEIVPGRFTQRVGCMGLLLISVAQGILRTRGAYTEKIILKPKILFEIWIVLHHGFILPLVWIYTIARKKRSILNVFQHLSSNVNGCSSRLGPLILLALLLIGVMFPILVEVLLILDGGKGRSLWDNFVQSSAQVQYELWIHPSPNSISPPLSTSTSAQGLTLLYIVLRTFSQVLLNLALLLLLISAFLILRRISRVHKRSLSAGSCNFLMLQVQVEVEELNQFVKLLNKMNGVIPLCLLSASVPFFVLQVFGAWDSDRVSLKYCVALKISIYMGIFIIASEAQWRGELLKSRLLELCHKYGKDGSLCGRIFRMELSLGVGYCGRLSYGVMGSIFSAYLSYAIMILQINGSPSPSLISNNCTAHHTQ